MKKNKKIILVICGLFILLSGFIYMNTNSIKEYLSDQNLKPKIISSSEADISSIAVSKSDNDHSDISESSDKQLQNTKVVVYICGAVKKPGVYTFSQGSRVDDAVKAAAGFKKGAAKTAINQARILEDGEQITIPTKKNMRKQLSQTAEGTKSSRTDSDASSYTENSGLININTASTQELTSLSGIGESRAEAIVEYRKTNGSFKEISDIMKISGIKEGVFNKIKDKISV